MGDAWGALYLEEEVWSEEMMTQSPGGEQRLCAWCLQTANKHPKWREWDRKSTWFGVKQRWVYILALSLTSCMTLERSHHLFESLSSIKWE